MTIRDEGKMWFEYYADSEQRVTVGEERYNTIATVGVSNYAKSGGSMSLTLYVPPFDGTLGHEAIHVTPAQAREIAALLTRVADEYEKEEA